MNGSTELAPCTCASEYQDRRYGPGLRVHNRGGAKTVLRMRCTICGVQKPRAAR